MLAQRHLRRVGALCLCGERGPQPLGLRGHARGNRLRRPHQLRAGGCPLGLQVPAQLLDLAARCGEARLGLHPGALGPLPQGLVRAVQLLQLAERGVPLRAEGGQGLLRLSRGLPTGGRRGVPMFAQGGLRRGGALLLGGMRGLPLLSLGPQARSLLLQLLRALLPGRECTPRLFQLDERGVAFRAEGGQCLVSLPGGLRAGGRRDAPVLGQGRLRLVGTLRLLSMRSLPLFGLGSLSNRRISRSRHLLLHCRPLRCELLLRGREPLCGLHGLLLCRLALALGDLDGKLRPVLRLAGARPQALQLLAPSRSCLFLDLSVRLQPLQLLTQGRGCLPLGLRVRRKISALGALLLRGLLCRAPLCSHLLQLVFQKSLLLSSPRAQVRQLLPQTRGLRPGGGTRGLQF
mmetsp:Transcript_37155/g.115592  ORF Transcript_37155/g.115592 Transcript_37155/m.115592 type:complete len:404 (+) Transcript_37155:769-1980(+)